MKERLRKLKSSKGEPHKEMSYEDALQQVVPFGVHEGKKLGDLVYDEKFTYLDWLNGARTSGAFKAAVKVVCQRHSDDIDKALDAEDDDRGCDATVSDTY